MGYDKEFEVRVRVRVSGAFPLECVTQAAIQEEVDKALTVLNNKVVLAALPHMQVEPKGVTPPKMQNVMGEVVEVTEDMPPEDGLQRLGDLDKLGRFIEEEFKEEIQRAKFLGQDDSDASTASDPEKKVGLLLYNAETVTDAAMKLLKFLRGVSYRGHDDSKPGDDRGNY